MTDLALFLGIAAVGHGLALWTRLPVLPMLILCGLAASLTPAAPSRETARAVVEFALAFLVFSAGIELSPRRFVHQTAAVMWVSAVQFLAVGAAAILGTMALGHSPMAAAYAGLAVSASSTVVVIRHLRNQQQMFTPFGRLVTGVLLVQDAVLIATLVALAQGETGTSESLVALSALAGLGLAAALFHWLVVPRLTEFLRGDDEVLLLSALGLLALFLAGAVAAGLPVVAGAMLAGFALASFPADALLRGMAGSVTDFFQALFFSALGALLVIESVAVVRDAVLLAALVFLVTPPLVAWVAEWRGLNARSGVESGLLLAQTSELGIVVALVGVSFGHISPGLFTSLALVAAITMTVTPFMATDAVTWRLLRLHPSARRAIPAGDLSGHVLVVGFGNAGMWVVKPLVEAGHRVLVLDNDPAVVAGLANAAVMVWRGDAADERTLDAVGARRALFILSALPSLGDTLRVIRHAAGVPVVARVFERDEAVAVQGAGGIPLLNSEAATEQFLAWFENFRSGDHGTRASQAPAA